MSILVSQRYWFQPNFDSSNLWYLAEVKTRLGQKEEAFELYKAAFKMPIITMDDGDTHDKVEIFTLMFWFPY